MQERILVFGAHPDDCEIGAGGIIGAYVEWGHRVVMVNLRVPCKCDGPCEEEEQQRRKEGERAARALGAELITFGLARDAIQPNAREVARCSGWLSPIQ